MGVGVCVCGCVGVCGCVCVWVCVGVWVCMQRPKSLTSDRYYAYKYIARERERDICVCVFQTNIFQNTCSRYDKIDVTNGYILPRSSFL